MTGATAWASLDRAFEAALRPVVLGPTAPVVLFSGGVDSTLLAWELRQVTGVSLFTVGTDGSADLVEAERAARQIGVPWTRRCLGDNDLSALRHLLADDLRPVPGPRRGIFVALSAGIAHAPPGRLVCGQGADELFLGYAHYRGLTAATALVRSSQDLRLLLDHDWPLTERIAARWGRELVAPYLDPTLALAVAELPPEERLPGTLTKELFRRWARHRGVPSELTERPKRALQYGSGVDRWLRRHPLAG